ncbi:hypothetical protein ACFOMD_11920 [Sphingoaurantiacus capsulatus]|uniref:Uncharacterized protein n=1 Tax=Sphingoaurantiacus capsulatus TaxID=1771310 RepID=A0ABV7XCY7_9SPHN
MSGLKRGLFIGLVLAAIIFFLPDGVLGAITVGIGLASVLPAAAPPLGMTARGLLAFAAFLPAFLLTLWLIRRRRNEWDVDDDYEPAPLSAAEQMDSGETITEPAYAPPLAPPAVYPAPEVIAPVAPARLAAAPSDLDDRLSRIEAALAALPGQIGGGDVLARVEALEAQISERLAAIDGRLAMQGVQGSVGGLRKPANAEKTIADIRRSIEGGGN